MISHNPYISHGQGSSAVITALTPLCFSCPCLQPDIFSLFYSYIYSIKRELCKINPDVAIIMIGLLQLCVTLSEVLRPGMGHLPATWALQPVTLWGALVCLHRWRQSPWQAETVPPGQEL